MLSITKLQNLKAIHNTCDWHYWGDGLLSITKLQNLKAIHNCVQRSIPMGNDVINHKTTKFESNSQLDTHSF